MSENSGSESGRPRWTRHPATWIGAVTLVVVLAIGLWAFQPWRVFTSSTVNEELPMAGQGAGEDTGAAPEDEESAPSEEPDPEPAVLAEGEFVSQEHETSGTVRVLELADGSRHVRVEDLESSDGPDLYVWLTDQEAGGDWFKYRDGRYVDLGSLKGTHGDANYEIPADADIEGMTSVVIWCDRFSVAFGSAPVEL
ncbi:DM13 domain-containing protein [Allosalinactinospora lopnorensis]|uniref:DM13 domain-containing protein n=1 Tax=Allosalinactinospora lopnorensis TaxID=1352348 RepID=UPI000A6E4EB3|nr:DM13 domain-containing protein [Allosalinactinospora lopnorensis]